MGGSVPFSIDDTILTLNNTPYKIPRQILCTKEASGKYWQIKSKINFYDSVPTLPLPTPPEIVSDDNIPF